MTAESTNVPNYEPRPGEWISPGEFANVIRLTPLVAIDLIVQDADHRVLVGRRLKQPARGFLFVPGSRISKNETRAMAFERITREELGVTVPLERARLLGVYDHLYPTNRFEQPGYGTHYIVLAHLLGLTLDSKSLPTDQHGEYFWLTPAEILSAPEVHEYTKAYFRT